MGVLKFYTIQQHFTLCSQKSDIIIQKDCAFHPKLVLSWG